MNQDFGLSLTPANARRLLMFQNISNISLPDEIEHLAGQDMIGEDTFDDFVCPYNEEKRVITQFLIDCDGRGIVQRKYHRFGGIEVVNVARFFKPDHIVIFAQQKVPWKMAAKAFFLDNVIVRDPFDLTNDEIDRFRSGVLIIDLERNDQHLHKIRSFASEFQRTILFDETNYPWPMLAEVLFPTMPHPFYPKVVKDIPTVWKNKPISMFAPFFNMCVFPQFIVDKQILSDDLMAANMLQYKRVFY